MRSTLWKGLFLLIWSTQLVAQGTPTPRGGLYLLDEVSTAIARHPSVEFQQQEVEIGGALQRQAAGAFDQVFDTAYDQGRLYSPFSQLSGFSLSPNDVSQIVASSSKLLRSGVSVTGSVDVRRQVDAAMRNGLTTSSTRLEVVFPLMRGRGTQVVTSGERAAGLERDGAALDLRHVTATVMARAASSYWELVAAERTRAVAVAAVERGDLLVDNTRALIAADQSPRSDLASALANAADRETARAVADQRYVEAGHRLLLDMGYRLDDRPEVATLDDFSLFGELPDLRDFRDDAESLVAGALERRADYLATQSRIDAARITRDAAVNGLLPQVDFSLNLGYTSAAEGRTFSRYLSAVAAGVEGPDIVGRISYRFPMQNRVSSGRLTQADAQLRQATLARDELARTIRSSVISSYSALRNAVVGVARAREAVEAFQEATRGEAEKLALGVGSIIALLTIEDRLTTAADREVAAWRTYSQALIDFRFATGSLVPVQGDLPAPDVRTFTTIPFALDAVRQ